MEKPKPKFNWRKRGVAVIKEGWEGAGRELHVIGPAYLHEQWWVPVIDPEEEDPTWHKEAGLVPRGRR